jgi:hypothetical protein
MKGGEKLYLYPFAYFQHEHNKAINPMNIIN